MQSHRVIMYYLISVEPRPIVRAKYFMSSVRYVTFFGLLLLTMSLGTSWLGYEFVLGTSWLGYELTWYELVLGTSWLAPLLGILWNITLVLKAKALEDVVGLGKLAPDRFLGRAGPPLKLLGRAGFKA